MPRMRFVDYAKYAGCTPSKISQAAKAGKITVFTDENGKKWLDSDLADQELNAAIDPAMVRRGKAIMEQVAEEEKAAKSVETPISFAASRAARERFNAELARLKFEEQSGKLIDAAEVQDIAFKRARTVRDALLNIPDRLAAELAAETNTFKVHEKLSTELRRALESFSVEE